MKFNRAYEQGCAGVSSHEYIIHCIAKARSYDSAASSKTPYLHHHRQREGRGYYSRNYRIAGERRAVSPRYNGTWWKSQQEKERGDFRAAACSRPTRNRTQL